MNRRVWVASLVAVLFSLSAGSGFAPAADDDLPLPKNLSRDAVLERYVSPGSTFAYLNGTMVHYKDEGRGPAVLLIHGSLQDLYDWDIWTEQLKKDFRVVRLDLPSLGFTGRVRSGDYSIDNTMRTVDALMDRLGERRFALVGTSYGGIVAFRYAATRTDRAAALILMNSAGVEWGNSKIIPPQKQRYNESLSDAVSRTQVRTILRAVYFDPSKAAEARVDRILDTLRQEGRSEEAAAVIAAYQRGEPAKVLATITAPVLVLWGAENRALAPSVADEFAKLLTHARTVEKKLVPGVSHWPHVEDPIGSVQPARAFLIQQVDSSSRAWVR